MEQSKNSLLLILILLINTLLISLVAMSWLYLWHQNTRYEACGRLGNILINNKAYGLVMSHYQVQTVDWDDELAWNNRNDSSINPLVIFSETMAGIQVKDCEKISSTIVPDSFNVVMPDGSHVTNVPYGTTKDSFSAKADLKAIIEQHK